MPDGRRYRAEEDAGRKKIPGGRRCRAEEDAGRKKISGVRRYQPPGMTDHSLRTQ